MQFDVRAMSADAAIAELRIDGPCRLWIGVNGGRDGQSRLLEGRARPDQLQFDGLARSTDLSGGDAEIGQGEVAVASRVRDPLSPRR